MHNNVLCPYFHSLSKPGRQDRHDCSTAPSMCNTCQFNMADYERMDSIKVAHSTHCTLHQWLKQNIIGTNEFIYICNTRLSSVSMACGDSIANEPELVTSTSFADPLAAVPHGLLTDKLPQRCCYHELDVACCCCIPFRHVLMLVLTFAPCTLTFAPCACGGCHRQQLRVVVFLP